ncbi:hypothetical protein BKA70DRAFT_1428494 [Coprinopsis sp. MPI-PUGE-AT-0042]|nr:hypothetical protein BKA70DRAFT_1428494 [Coprinopsis sp. MPI-PUGE-AT-0042]
MLSETLQSMLGEESTSSGKNPGVEAKARATLLRAEALPPLSVTIDDSIVIKSGSRAPKPSKAPSVSDAKAYTLNIPLDSLELPPELSHCNNDYTLASLRLAASIIDRSQGFDVLVRCIKDLKVAVERFNLANSNVLASSILYQAIENQYADEYPAIPPAMGRITDSGKRREYREHDDAPAIPGRYYRKLRTLQAAMGLDEDTQTFSRIHAAVLRTLRKLGYGSVHSRNHGPYSTETTGAYRNDRKNLITDPFGRLAWLVERDCPVVRRYESSWPTEALISIHQAEVWDREQEFREKNGSSATLPDYHTALIDEVVLG